jgi:hypothetical protein
MKQQTKDKIFAKDKWLRALFMVMYLIIMFIVKIVLWFVIAFQFIAILFTDKPNKMLLEFSKSLSIYTYQMLMYLTYNAETKPYPLSSWPKSEADITK